MVKRIIKTLEMKTFYTTSIFALVLLITSSISMNTYGQVLAVNTTTNTDKVKRGSNHLQKPSMRLRRRILKPSGNILSRLA